MHATTSKTRNAFRTGTMDADSALTIFLRDLIRPKSRTTLRTAMHTFRYEPMVKFKGCKKQLSRGEPDNAINQGSLAWFYIVCSLGWRGSLPECSHESEDANGHAAKVGQISHQLECQVHYGEWMKKKHNEGARNEDKFENNCYFDKNSMRSEEIS